MTYNKDKEASDHPEVPVSGARYYGSTQKTPDYVRTMDINVRNIDKSDNNKWSTIYDAIDTPYSG